MSTLKDIFNILRNKETEPAHVSFPRFAIETGGQTRNFPVLVTKNGDRAEMATVLDLEQGKLHTAIRIAVKAENEPTRTFNTHFIAERSSKHPDYFEIKSMMLDNRVLDVRNGGHVELCLHHIGNYERYFSGFGRAHGWGFPLPFAMEPNNKLDRDIKRRGNMAMRKLEQVGNYLSAKAQRKFWLGE